MKGLVIYFCLILAISPGQTSRHHHHSDMCRPCAGAYPAVARRFPDHTHNTNYQPYCSALHETHIRISELRRNISEETEEMVSSVFDGDVSYIDENPLVFSGPDHISQMTLTYNKLVYLHVIMKLLETHPDKHSCAVTTSAIADRFPFCHLRSIMSSETPQSSEFRSVCSENGYIDLNSCGQVQRYAYRVLRTASHVLHDVHREIKSLQREHSCRVQ